MDAAPRRAVTDRPATGDGSAESEQTMLAAVPEEPLAVVAAGPAGAGRSAVLGALLAVPPAALRVPRGSYLLVGPGEAGEGEAYVPGYRRPYPYRAEPLGAGPALARPPRRVELALPAALLRHACCLDTPDTALLGPSGRWIVRDVVERGGALLFVLATGTPPAAEDLELLADVAVGEAAVFFVATPGAPVRAGTRTTAPMPTGTGAADALRATVLAAVPALAEAPWFEVDPAVPADIAPLRQALLDWAAPEALRRAGLAGPMVPEAAGEGFPVAGRAATSDWADRLETRVRGGGHRVRQSLALELANIHLRCVQAIVFGAGCPGLPELLDQELHALSIRAVQECEAGVREVLDDVLGRVFEPPPDSPGRVDEGLRRRVAVAVGWGLAGHRRGQDLDRVLLVGSDGMVHPVTGLGAVRALTAYPAGCGAAVLPPLGIALAGGCYQHWRNPTNANVAKARFWLQRVLREVELELSREVLRRFAAVQTALAGVLRDAIDEGVLRV